MLRAAVVLGTTAALLAPVQGPPVVFAVPTGQVALTFDDGPGRATPAVLDVLDRQGVKATFFVVGTWAQQRPADLERMAAAGHSVQNHTWNHPDLVRRSDAVVADQLRRTSDLVELRTGVRPRCMRPPGGSHSRRTDQVAATEGLQTVMWNTDSGDWRRRRPSVGQIVHNVLRVAKGGGLVVVFHDGGANHANTALALPAIIDGLRQRGYTFVTLCQPPPPPTTAPATTAPATTAPATEAPATEATTG